MKEFLDVLRQVDVAAPAGEILSFLTLADPYFVGPILALLTLLGFKMVSRHRSLRNWGILLAVGTILAYVGYSYWLQGELAPEEIRSILVRAILVTMALVAPLWVVLPILAFLYSRLRLAAAAFLGYVCWAWMTWEKIEPQDVQSVAIGGGITAGLALIVAWILQPFTDFFYKYCLLPLLPQQPTKKRQQSPEESLVSSRRSGTEQPEDSSNRAEDTSRSKPKPKQTQTEKTAAAPGKEKENEERRHRARLRAEVCYALYESVLSAVFPRSMFDEFVTRYLSDRKSPARVEQNVAELEAVILDYVNTHSESQSPPTIPLQCIDMSSLTSWFLNQKQRIEAQELDEEQKTRKLANLTRRYSQLAGKVGASG